MKKPAIGAALLVLGVLTLLGYLYLFPASQLLLRGDTSMMIGDGGDPTTLPFFYDVIIRTFQSNPLNLLYGAVPADQLNPPYSFSLWVPWIERLLALLYAPFIPVETMPTAVMWGLMVLNGAVFYAFGRREGWRPAIALALAAAFAFNPFTRARSISHSALVGIYYLPAVFLALRLTQRPTSRKSLIGAALLLLLAVSAAHYYIMILVALSPFLLWFYLRDLAPKKRTRYRVEWTLRPLARLIAVSFPAVLFLAWNVLAPVPPAYRGGPAVQKPQIDSMYLMYYNARPIDYLAGDVSHGSSDLNPFRSWITEYVRQNWDTSNPVERSNGIRWSLLFPFLAILVLFVGRKKFRRKLDPALAKQLRYFLVFAVFAYLCSRSPRIFAPAGIGMGPSLWIHLLMPHFRVPSRFGPVFHFGLLVVVGSFFEAWLSSKRPKFLARRFAPGGFAAGLLLLMILDYAPLHAVQMDRTYPRLTWLDASAPGGDCGTGMVFPYLTPFSPLNEERPFYRTIQRLRATDCKLANLPMPEWKTYHLTSILGTDPYQKAQATPESSRAMEDRVVRFAECTRMDWILFGDPVSPAARERICQRLGWKRFHRDACRAPGPTNDFVDPETCFGVL